MKMKKAVIILTLIFWATASYAGDIVFKTAVFRTGDDMSWSAASLDESLWEKISIVGNDHFTGITGENTYAWYRIHFSLTEKIDRKAFVLLHLGYIDDSDETYLNGRLIGKNDSYNIPRVYQVDASCLNAKGDNVIAIRVRNDGGSGGIGEGESTWVPNGKYIETASDAGEAIGRMLENFSSSVSKSRKDIHKLAHYGRYAGSNKEVASRPNDGHRVVLMGDSITDGWPVARPEFFSTNDIIGRGISGETSYQFLLRFQNDVIDLHPAVVVINYGTNDIAENTGAYVEELTFSNVKAMCEMARGAGIKVVLASTLPHGGFLWNPSITDAMQKVVSLNARVKEYALQEGIIYVDYFSEMVSSDGTRMREDLSKDGVHPNGDGYQIMEDMVLPIVKSLR